MTRRISLSLPDDVAEYVQRSPGRTSAFIADVLRRKMRADGLRVRWAEHGYAVTDESVERARRRLAEHPPISDEQHDRNMRWLRQFGDAGA
ncbi:hypothetical protein O7598_06755 [Micromonospora sp. WMMC241]|uniref:hypothetical protein n=1 Tax=Micromonospora sp. WMMC241 TaxID=3015159 RepID=UPI0022B6CD56|nr:hypothetical protein [Micromonospora sp. WMMC241]MCZ7436085.1 hypothetical protein [Micromonospora sp. WMMC241]